jgi:hypothetical protein
MRLAVGTALDVVLLLMLPRLAVWRGDERDCALSMAYAPMGAAAMVSVFPVVRRGTDLQRVGAVVVLILSALAFWPALDFYQRITS